jgi:hypothetical protein
MKTCSWALTVAFASTAFAFSTPLASAQDTSGVGIVTTLDGQATVARSTLPQPLPLKFKDDVFEKDRISTAENSLVRVLLGGKAVVTVRELSVLTITENLGRAEINLQSGKIALAVAKQRMKPGETITIRARNAVAAIRGTVVVAEIRTATAQAGSPAQFGGIGTFHVFSGTVDVTPPGGTTFQVGPGDSGDSTGRRWTRTGAENVNVNAGLHTSNRGGPPATVWQNQLAQAEGVGQFLLGNSNFGGPNQDSLPRAPINPDTNSQLSVKTLANLIQNPGAELGLSGWTQTGAVHSVSAFGFIEPPDGNRMFLIHTGTGSVGSTTSTLSQSFTLKANDILAISLTYNFVTNEFPTQSTFYNDTFIAKFIDPSGAQTQLATESRNSSSFTVYSGSVQPINQDGYTTVAPEVAPEYGATGFKTVTRQLVTSGTAGLGQLSFTIFDQGDAIFDSAALIDAVAVQEDPPLYFFRSGDVFVRSQADPLVQFVNTPQSFDSALVVCCGGRATLAGPLLRAINSDLTVGFSLLTASQGGSLVSASTDPLVLLQGGSHSLGTAGVAMFDLSGVNSAVDAGTGLTLGTDRPVQTGGALFQADGATVHAYKGVQIDTALLEASAPLLALTAGSRMTTAAEAVDLSFRAQVTSLGSVVRLDSSTLTVANGSAINVAAGVLRVTGALFTLLNGSTLNVLNGALLSASGGSNVSVSGALIAFGGGGNVVSVANSFCPCTTISGIPVSLGGGATAAQVSIGAGAISNPALGSVTPNTALIRVTGPSTRVTIGGGS